MHEWYWSTPTTTDGKCQKDVLYKDSWSPTNDCYQRNINNNLESIGENLKSGYGDVVPCLHIKICMDPVQPCISNSLWLAASTGDYGLLYKKCTHIAMQVIDIYTLIGENDVAVSV